MKLFTLKRFFVVTLLMCLGVSQGWADEFGFNATNGKDADLSWEKDGITFKFVADNKITPEFYDAASNNNNFYNLKAGANTRFTWENKNEDYFIRVKKIKVERDIIYTTFAAGIAAHAPAENTEIKCKFNDSDPNSYKTYHQTAPNWQSAYTIDNLSVLNSGALSFVTIGDNSYSQKIGWLSYVTNYYYGVHSINVEYDKIYYYHSAATVAKSAGGTAEVDRNNHEIYVKTTEDNPSVTYTFTANPAPGYVFKGWSETEGGEIKYTNLQQAINISYQPSDHNKEIKTSLYAHFVKKEDYLKENYDNTYVPYLLKSSKVVNAKTVADLEGLNVLTLDEKATNYSATAQAYDAVVVKRAFKSGKWNTFCVPFNMPKSELAGAKIKYLESVAIDENNNNYTLNFVDESGDNVLAGKPYIVNIPENKTVTVVGAANVEVKSDSPVTNDDSGVSFIGTYIHIDNVPKDGKSYIISDNKFYLVASDVYLDGFRGYFHIPGETPALSASFDDEDVTGITTVINGNDNGNDNLYNIAGQRVNENAKGIIIKNGKKFLVK